MTFWLAVVLSGIATYVERAGPLVTPIRLPERGAARAYVDALPTAVIAALAGAAVLAPTGSLTAGAEVIGAAAAAAAAAWRRHVLFAMLAGIAAVALARAGGY